MMDVADLIVRGGTLFDGTGGAPFEADLAVKNGLQASASSSFMCYIRQSTDALGWIKPWMLR